LIPIERAVADCRGQRFEAIVKLSAHPSRHAIFPGPLDQDERHDRIYRGLRAWTSAYRRWLTTVRFDHPAQRRPLAILPSCPYFVTYEVTETEWVRPWAGKFRWVAQ
jgi:hypothetical protein